MSRRAVFLDRDGVINRYTTNYVRTFDDFAFYPEAEGAFALLGGLGAPIVVVTNQSGIGRGYTTRAIVDAIHDHMIATAARWGAAITTVEICPHTPDDRCDCRKPAPAMFTRAAEAHDLALAGSFLVGDSPCDIEGAVRLGMRPVRVRTGRGSEALPNGIEAEATADDFLAAVRWIVEAWPAPLEPPRSP